MATIEKRGERWRARVRRGNGQHSSKSFRVRAAAEKWAREQEHAADLGKFLNPSLARTTTLGELIGPYIEAHTSKKRGHEAKRYRLKKMAKDPICRVALAGLDVHQIEAYVGRRVDDGAAPATINRELNLFQNIINKAKNGREPLVHHNPFKGVSRMPVPKFNDRRLANGAWTRIDCRLPQLRKPEHENAIRLLYETTMRRGEGVNPKWKDVHLGPRFIRLRDTKNGEERNVPLTTRAIEVLERQAARRDEPLVFPGFSPAQARRIFRRACGYAKVEYPIHYDRREDCHIYQRTLTEEDKAAIRLSRKRRNRDYLQVALAALCAETRTMPERLLGLAWSDLPLDGQGAEMRVDGKRCQISTALARLLRYIKAEKQARVFPFLSPEALTRSWGRVCKLAHVHDYVLHGLRHDGLSRFADGGTFSTLDLAAISGHKSLKTLQRYVHHDMTMLAARMDSAAKAPSTESTEEP